MFERALYGEKRVSNLFISICLSPNCRGILSMGLGHEPGRHGEGGRHGRRPPLEEVS